MQHIPEKDAYWDQVRPKSCCCTREPDQLYGFQLIDTLLRKSTPPFSTRPRMYSRSFRLKTVSISSYFPPPNLRADRRLRLFVTAIRNSSPSTGRSTREHRDARPRRNLPPLQPRLGPHVPLRPDDEIRRHLLRVVAHQRRRRRRRGAQRDQGSPELPARLAARPARDFRAGERTERV